VIDTPGVLIAPFQVINILNSDVANVEELGRHEEKWEEFRTKYPDRWNADGSQPQQPG